MCLQRDEPVTVVISNLPEPLARYHVLREVLGPDRWERLNLGALQRTEGRHGAPAGRDGPLVEVDVPVRDLLRPRLPEQSEDWKAMVFRYLTRPDPNTAAAGEVLQRQLTREWSLWSDDVLHESAHVALVDPEGRLAGAPGLTFQVGGKPVPSEDGGLWVAPLDAAAGGKLGFVTELVNADAQEVSEAASLALLTDSAIDKGREMVSTGHGAFSQDEVTGFAQLLADLSGRLTRFDAENRGAAGLLGGYRERFEAFRRAEAMPFIDEHPRFLARNQPSQSMGETLQGSTQSLMDMQDRAMKEGGFFGYTAAGEFGEAATATAASLGMANMVTGGAVETSKLFHEAFRAGHISLDAFEKGVAQARNRGLIFGAITAALTLATWGLAGPALGTGASIGRQVLFYGGSAALGTMATMGATSYYTAQTPLPDAYAQQIWAQGRYSTRQILYGGALSFGLGAAIPMVSWLARPSNAGLARALVAASAESRALPPLESGLQARTVAPGVVEITQAGQPGAIRLTAQGWELHLAAGRGQAPVLAEPWQDAVLPPVRPELLEQVPALAGLRDIAGVSLGGRPVGIGVTADGWFASAPGTGSPLLSGSFGAPAAGAGPLSPFLTGGMAAPAGPIRLVAGPGGRLLIVELQAGPMVGNIRGLPGFGQPGFLPQAVAGIPGATGVAIEGGDYLIGYPRTYPGLFGQPPMVIPGVYPTNPLDLAMARQIVQSTPQWPPYTAGQVGQALSQLSEAELAGSPLVAQPWEIDPSMAFPRTGPVATLTQPGPGGGAVPQAWFPAVGGSSVPGGPPRLVPMGQPDARALVPSTHPELHGLVDRIYWRRPFAMEAASADDVRAMGQEIGRMLKPGGFAEFRLLRAGDEDVVTRLQDEIGVSSKVTVNRSAIRQYELRPGVRPAGLTDEQWQVLQDAGPDILGQQGGLGEGQFSRIIRVYKKPIETPGAPGKR